MKTFFTTLVLTLAFNLSFGQYWQQEVDYTMEVSLEAKTARYTGFQKLVYTNNSPEKLNKVF